MTNSQEQEKKWQGPNGQENSDKVPIPREKWQSREAWGMGKTSEKTTKSQNPARKEPGFQEIIYKSNQEIQTNYSGYPLPSYFSDLLGLEGHGGCPG